MAYVNDRAAVFRMSPDPLHDQVLVMKVGRRRRLVEQDDRCLLGESPRQRHSCLLPSRKRGERSPRLRSWTVGLDLPQRQVRRPEAARHVTDYLRGLLAEVERKNGWRLAEPAGYAHPRGRQRVLPPAHAKRESS